ncbi:putative secreted protein [Clostridium bornimense]|uniref:Putative secreted protein n=1 Tax=Clostridium bornimense TaxID=1216932 RepID=W6S638_9CLOT|nr:DUF2207 domain-containing protein [Clostridium bornimense]CDM69822.1 putative secreted protein [Clostridium bornimense]
MKKFKSVILIMITIATVFFNSIMALADDDGYYIENMKVDVEVNDARQYMITETIDVYFNESRHGITRNIPTSSVDENYDIKDIAVTDDKYTIQSNQNEIIIKIGDSKKEVKGKKRYVIKYTLDNYADEEDDGDYIYLNVLGAQWDTTIKNFTATITYPEEAVLEKYWLYSGEYGDTDNEFVNLSKNKNNIILTSKNEIPSNNAITIKARLSEGAFKNARQYQYPFIIKNETENIEITKNQEYIVDKSFVINVVNSDEQCVIDLWDDYNLLYKSKIEGINVSDKDIFVDEKNRKITLPKVQGEYKFNIHYKVIPVLHSDVNINLNPSYNNIKVEKLTCNIKSYYDIEGINNKLSSSKYDITINKNNIKFENRDEIKRGNDIDLKVNINTSLFSRKIPFAIILAVVWSAVVFIISIYIYKKYCKKKKLTPKLDIYYPNNINSTEMAYIIKGKVIPEDVVSLIFYWASENCIKIKIGEKKKNKLKFIKLRELDEKHKEYEKDMFESMFSKGDGNEVTTKKLKKSFYLDINRVKSKISKEFRGEKALRDRVTIVLSVVSLILSQIPIIIVAIAKTIVYNENFNYILPIIGINIALSIVLYFVGIYISKKIYDGDLSKLRIRLIVFIGTLLISSISIISLYSIAIPFQYIVVTIILSYINILISGLMPSKSQYAIETIENILGFKKFVTIAEKERLETLVDENAKYFYDILPYAQVLGVTSTWCDKFKDITMEPSTWYYSNTTGSSYYDYLMITAMTKSMASICHDVTTPPVTSTTNSIINSYSNGGFSGGGSGGGGGSSW